GGRFRRPAAPHGHFWQPAALHGRFLQPEAIRVWPDFLARLSAWMETIRSPGPDRRRLRGGQAPHPRKRSHLSTPPGQRGPKAPRRPTSSRRTTAPFPRAWLPHDRRKPPKPPKPTADVARFLKKFGILNAKRCRGLGRETGRFFGMVQAR